MSEEKQIKEDPIKIGFFQKVWDSIMKIEKYPDMAADGFRKAFTYLCKLVVILTIVLCLGMMYQTYQILQEGVHYLQDEFPDFQYKENQLHVDAKERITISEEDSYIGRTIIDTNTEDQQKINQYINEIENTGSGVIVLKDKVILKNGSVAGTINYNYSDILGRMEISECNKQDVVDYVTSSQSMALYVSIFLTIFVCYFIMYLLTTLSNAVFLSIFGYLTTWVARIKMRFAAIFNMSVYALTLSILLNAAYIGINIFIHFYMEYFQVMYVAVAAIYLVAAIFLLKTEFIKRQAELQKIVEAQEIVRKEMEEKEQKEKEEQEKKEKEKEEKKEEDKNTGEEPEGSNA